MLATLTVTMEQRKVFHNRTKKGLTFAAIPTWTCWYSAKIPNGQKANHNKVILSYYKKQNRTEKGFSKQNRTINLKSAFKNILELDVPH